MNELCMWMLSYRPKDLVWNQHELTWSRVAWKPSGPRNSANADVSQDVTRRYFFYLKGQNPIIKHGDICIYKNISKGVYRNIGLRPITLYS